MPALVVIAVAIAVLVALVVWAKVHPFLAFILVSAGAAFALGMPAGDVAGAVRKGIGDIFGTLAIVIVAGAMLGKLVVESGAAQRIADTLVKAFGEKQMARAMAVTGFIVGIPLFCGVGFVLLVPIIIIAVVSRSRQPRLLPHERLGVLNVQGVFQSQPGRHAPQLDGDGDDCVARRPRRRARAHPDHLVAVPVRGHAGRPGFSAQIQCRAPFSSSAGCTRIACGKAR